MTRNELIVAICREAGDKGTDADLIEGYAGNYAEWYLTEVVDAAATGDVEALIRMRSDAGLPIIR